MFKRLFRLHIDPKKTVEKFQDIVIPVGEYNLRENTDRGHYLAPIYVYGYANREDAIKELAASNQEGKYYLLTVKEVLIVKPKLADITSSEL